MYASGLVKPKSSGAKAGRVHTVSFERAVKRDLIGTVRWWRRAVCHASIEAIGADLSFTAIGANPTIWKRDALGRLTATAGVDAELAEWASLLSAESASLVSVGAFAPRVDIVWAIGP